MKPKAEFQKIAELEQYLQDHDSYDHGAFPVVRVKYQSEYGLRFPRRGRAYASCGEFLRVNVCPDFGEKTLNGVEHTAYTVKNHCDRADCPVCATQWMYREGSRAEVRIKKANRAYLREGVKLGYLKHLSFSPPQEVWKRIIMEKGLFGILRLRREAEALIMRAGVKGGSILVHPWRWHKETGERYLSPHVHVVGFGHVMGYDEFYKMSGGWVYKNHGVRVSVLKTISYLLSHTCLADGYKTLTYFGCLAYNKLKKIHVLIRKERPKCGCCGKDLIAFCVGSDGLTDYSKSFNLPAVGVESFDYKVIERKLSVAILA